MNDDDILVINTEDSVSVPKQIDPLTLYGDSHPMLSTKIPEYPTETLPNQSMNILVQRLKMTMKKFAGIGLSANQCGVFERVFVMGTDDWQMVCINPKIIKESAINTKDPEGCLSFPGFYLKVSRSELIDVEYTTETGEVKRQTLTGISAKCFLHELDHMNGIKFTQHVGPVALKLAKQKQLKLIKKIQRRKK